MKAQQPLTIIMLSMHTSPLEQPGQGDAGGMNVYVRHTAESLAELGHEVLVFTRKTNPTESEYIPLTHPNLRYIPVQAGPVQTLDKEDLFQWVGEFAENCASEIGRQKNLAVIHSHYWLSGLVGLQLSKLLHLPLVHTMHTMGAVKNEQDGDATEPQQRIESELRLIRETDVLVANTVAEETELLSIDASAAHKIHVVPPGVDHLVFSPEGPTFWPEATQQGSIRLLFAGRFQAHKGPQIILDALAEMRRRGDEILPRVHFSGARSGSAAFDLEKMAKQAGLADWCSFSTPVSPIRLAAMMRAADVVVVPSFSESFGFVAVEAQACGTAVIAHKVGGLRTVVDDEHTGSLLPSLDPAVWADEFEDVVNRPAVWETRGAVAVQHARQFSWYGMAKKLVEIYQRTMSA